MGWPVPGLSLPVFLRKVLRRNSRRWSIGVVRKQWVRARSEVPGGAEAFGTNPGDMGQRAIGPRVTGIMLAGRTPDAAGGLPRPRCRYRPPGGHHSFVASAWAEPKLISFAYDYEQATHRRVPPTEINHALVRPQCGRAASDSSTRRSLRLSPPVGWVDNPSKLERALGGLRLER
jgi:hypothetical protein